MTQTLSADMKRKLEKVLTDTFFRDYPPGYLSTEKGQFDLRMQVNGRYDECLHFVVPWIQRAGSLRGKRIVEIGCGTGSATAALAPLADGVLALDIDEISVTVARARIEVLGLDNCQIERTTPDGILSLVEERCGAGIDVCVIYAVLEHQTLPERLAMLRTVWRLLRPGGMLVVNETPNRLLPEDGHTSLVPFFNMLPDDVALLVAQRSPRQLFRDAFPDPAPMPETLLRLARWGRGVSHHDFEIALGSLEGLCVADSYQPEILRYRALCPEEVALRQYVEKKELAIPAGFLRTYLDVILRKPGGEVQAPPLRNPRTVAALNLFGVQRKQDGTLVLLSPASYIQFDVAEPSRRLLLAMHKHPWSGALQVTDQNGRLIFREVLTTPEGADWDLAYAEIPLPAGVRTVTLRTDPRHAARGGEAWFMDIAVR